MSLILFPRPRILQEGKPRWKPRPALLRAMDSLSLRDDLSDFIDFSNDRLPPQAYALHAGPEGIRIACSDEPGRWNALASLRQILRQVDESGELPEIRIQDAPAFPVRGIMLDVSRNRVPTMNTIKQLTDIWAGLKVNQIQLYTEHTFAYTAHETVWKHASPFTPGEIEELDEYCAERAVELVPNQNSFGHMERWLRHREYHRFAECPEGFEDPWGVFRQHGSTLNLERPESLELLGGLYDELLPHFRSRTFNIGGDETYDLGKGVNAALCKKQGVGRVYLRHLRRIIAEVEKRDHTPQFWADIILHHPELLPEVPSEAVVLNWGYEPDHPFEKETAALAESRREFQVCPGTASWNSPAGRWSAARDNIAEAAKWGLKNGASGFLVTDWGDNGHKQQYIAAMPGWFAGASAAWRGTSESGGESGEETAAALQMHLFGNPGGREAERLLRLADVYRENPVHLHNMSFLALPLMDHHYPYYRSRYDEIGRAGTGRAREIAEEAASALSWEESTAKAAAGASGGPATGTTALPAPAADTWRRQLAFTAEITALAADLAEPFYASADHRIDRFPAALRRTLARRLERTTAGFADLWRNVCRPGGLDESLEGFAGLMERLRT